jgi:hypothetical protein
MTDLSRILRCQLHCAASAPKCVDSMRNHQDALPSRYLYLPPDWRPPPASTSSKLGLSRSRHQNRKVQDARGGLPRGHQKQNILVLVNPSLARNTSEDGTARSGHATDPGTDDTTHSMYVHTYTLLGLSFTVVAVGVNRRRQAFWNQMP